MSATFDVFISYRRNGGASEARLIQARLLQRNLKIFLDVDSLQAGHFDEALLKCIAEAPNFVLILSPGCLDRCLQDAKDWLRQEIVQAIQTTRNIVPVIMPGFRFPDTDQLPEDIRDLRRHQSVSYSHEFFDAMIAKLFQYLHINSSQDAENNPGRNLKNDVLPSLLTIPIGSKAHFVRKNEPYVSRPADEALKEALERQESSILIQGNRQTGKTLLIAKSLQRAKANNTKTVFTDLQKFTSSSFRDIESLYLAFADSIADQLDLDVFPLDTWKSGRDPHLNFQRFLRREVFGKIQEHIIWSLDEVDRLFSFPFYADVFALFRSWHNERSMDPTLPWFTVILACTSESSLFVTDSNMSPFNVGTKLKVGDFTVEQIAELNRLYDEPLRDTEQINKFYDLVSGHPFLVCRGLATLSKQTMTLEELISCADGETGPFDDHLRLMLGLLENDDVLYRMVQDNLAGQSTLTNEGFIRLKVAGFLRGESAAEARIRCSLYDRYFRRTLSVA